MRTSLCGILSLALLVIATSSYAQATKKTPLRGAASLPQGAVHLIISSDADARKTFTYFPYPPVAAAPRPRRGVYRLEVNPQGAVAAITVLKSMGPARDATAMKTFVQWRAKPGPLRIVDVGWQIRQRVIYREGHYR
jgi:outer membrane biosynthesis protein TonB